MKLLPYLLVIGVVLYCGIASAQTPDGETPAEESVCDDLKWATPGLYGLCVAFCEAQDCEPDFSLANPLENCRPASRKILDNYRKKMQPGDPDMPCIQEPCPCWSPDELDLLWPPLPINSDQCSLFPLTDFAGFWYPEPLESPPPYYHVSTMEQYPILMYPLCEFWYNDGDVDILRVYRITLEEHLICKEQVIQKGDELGFECFMP